MPAAGVTNEILWDTNGMPHIYGHSRQRGTTYRSDQLTHLSKLEFRELWLTRSQIEANISKKTELKP